VIKAVSGDPAVAALHSHQRRWGLVAELGAPDSLEGFRTGCWHASGHEGISQTETSPAAVPSSSSD